MIGILVFTFIFLIIGLVFLVKNIRKYHFVKNTKNKYLSWLITILPFIIIRLLFNGVNTIIIILHLIIFLIIAEAIIYIIKRICKKEFKCNITGISCYFYGVFRLYCRNIYNRNCFLSSVCNVCFAIGFRDCYKRWFFSCFDFLYCICFYCINNKNFAVAYSADKKISAVIRKFYIRRNWTKIYLFKCSSCICIQNW